MPNVPLSVTIICYNEEANIARAIQSVKWATEVLVVDSGSTDRTVEIAESMGARVIRNPWPGYGKQKNFAQNQAENEWVLNLDADEWIPAPLAEEIQRKLQAVQTAQLNAVAFAMPRKTYYLGRWIRYGGWYPNIINRVANRKYAYWSEPHVHEALIVEGPVMTLTNAIEHEAFRTISDQILTNLKFSRLGMEDLVRRRRKPSYFKLVLKPLGKFFETYLIKRGFMDGLRGLIISVNAAHSMFLKYAFLFEKELLERTPHADPDHR